jgi:hypothetical protein
MELILIGQLEQFLGVIPIGRNLKVRPLLYWSF